MRYVFIVNIYISLLHSKTRELQIAVSRLIRFVIRDFNSPYIFLIYTLSILESTYRVYVYLTH